MEISDDREDMISWEFPGNLRNPGKNSPIHASAATSQNGSREPALPNPAGVCTRPSEKNCWVPVRIFSNSGRPVSNSQEILGIPRKSWENHPRANSENRAPDTNRRCGRLRMVRVVVSGPTAAARRRVGTADGRYRFSQDFLGILGILGK